MIVDQEVPGSRPGGGTNILIGYWIFSEKCFIQIDVWGTYGGQKIAV